MSKGNLSPQCATVLAHLVKAGSITNVEAQAVHRVYALPRRIADLKAHGVRINSNRKVDVTGVRYVRYVLAANTDVAA